MHIDSFIELHEAYNKVIHEVARCFDAPVVDVEATVPTGRTYFYDSMHLRKAGGELLADAMVNELRRNQTFRQISSDKAEGARE